jgi:LPS-assembly lipoprotein
MSSSERRVWLGRAAALAAAAALPSCGFELRQPPHLRFGSIALQGFRPHSALADELSRQLRQQVRVLDGPDRADVVLQSLLDLRDKSVVASTAAAQVREFTLRLQFHFRAHTPGGKELIPLVELLLTRDLSYSENFALAKEQEEAELYLDMQSDVVTQVLRRLAAISV